MDEPIPARTRDEFGRFLRGAPGGPGRPKLGDCLSDALRKYGALPMSELADLAQKKDLPAWDVIAISQLLAAMDMASGDRARKDLADRMEGRPDVRVTIDDRDEEKLALLRDMAQALSREQEQLQEGIGGGTG